MCPDRRAFVFLLLLAACSRTGLDLGDPIDASAPTLPSDDATPPVDAFVADACQGTCPPVTVTFASGTDWPSFAATEQPSAGDTPGQSMGPAAEVCAGPSVPANCPSGAVILGNAASGWNAGLTIPQANWIWRGDVTPSQPADLQLAVFQRTFSLGQSPTGSIQIGADDFAEVFVDDVSIGSVGSVTDISLAGASQNSLTSFDLTAALHPGANTITIVGQNGPASYAGGCEPAGCTYASNPAGVVFMGTLSSP
jgi:hypothetical protein